MRGHLRPSLRSLPATGRVGLAILLGMAASTCDLPTDASAELGVALSSNELRLVLGESVQLNAEVQGADLDASGIRFESLDPQILQVSESGLALGVGRGETQVVASLRSFAEARADTARVVVLETVSFDTVYPDTVRYGETLTIVGLGLDPARLSALSVGGFPASVRSFVPGRVAEDGSRDTLRVYVPAGAASDASLVGLHVTGASETRRLTVIREDLYEPNDDQPARIDGPTNLTNPQLSFEAGGGFDWYRLRDIQGSFTVVVEPLLPLQSVLGSVRLSAPRAERGDIPEWSVADAEYPHCNGLEVRRERAYFFDEDATGDVLRFPVMDPVEDSLDLTIRIFAAPAEPLRYLVRVEEGYQGDVAPDAFEPNDHCGQAADLPASFEEFISFDGPADMDWFRFSVPAEGARFQARVDCTRCQGADNLVSLSVYPVTSVADPDRPGTLPQIYSDYAGFSGFLDVALELPAGEYFMSVHNEFYEGVDQVLLTTFLTPNS
ncbi:MAG: hypothetical protein JSU98_05590 [Gemmatimonadales bacterium]|nr:MAG: hypothetical protein JSU98_05590 [Gemmatimonadales bacterium]